MRGALLFPGGALALFLLLLQPVWSQAAAFGEDEELEQAVRLAEEELARQNNRISQVKYGLAVQEEAVGRARKQEKGLLDELARYDEKIMEESRLLVEYFQQAQEHKELSREREQEYEQVQQEKEMLRLMTEKRLAAYYRLGDYGVLNITFSSSTLPDLVNFQEHYRFLLRHDRKLINRFRAKLVDVAAAKTAHEEQRRELEGAMDLARKQRDILSAAKEERGQVLARVKVEKHLHEQASQELNVAMDELLTNLATMEAEVNQARREKEEWEIEAHPLLPHKKRRPAWARGFAGQQGQLPLPVTGELVSLFQEGVETVSGLGALAGIDFDVKRGAQVRAVFRGKVIYAGFVKGYGQLVIVSHADGYYTMTSPLTKFMVKKGDEVESGSVLGLSGDHVGMLAEPLHFEIRHKLAPLDPLQWLNGGEIVYAPALEMAAGSTLAADDDADMAADIGDRLAIE
ncbi:MAG: peptidoglycan DD-metalloendopeptidase family protein [Thermodesulfobacteriota bacterium]